MPNWGEVLNEISKSNRKDALDYVRKRYLTKLQKKTGRNIICYYSAFLQRPGTPRTEITDEDKNGFMACVHGLDKGKGLDLFLHTPGGQIAATESIVHYLRQLFGTDIRAIVPQIAMSAGTLISCSCKEIIMGKHSNLGPVDPQFGGIPAQGVIAEFKKAKEEIKEDPTTIPLWQTVVSKYHPTFIGECQHAIDLSEHLLDSWLRSGMLHEDPDVEAKIARIKEDLASHDRTKTHSRHIHYEEAQGLGLKIKMLEADGDQELQDLILTIHHTFMHVFSQAPTVSKLIENHLGRRMVMHTGKRPAQPGGGGNG